MIVYTNYKRMRSLKWHIIESLKRTINSSKRIWNHNSCLFVYCKKEHIHHRNQDYNCARQTHVLSNKDTPVTLELKRSKMPCKVKKLINILRIQHSERFYQRAKAIYFLAKNSQLRNNYKIVFRHQVFLL